jgi:hypothetical protein
MSPIGIGVAAIVAFVISFAFYSLVTPEPPADDRSTESASNRPAAWQVVVELLRSAITATLTAGLLNAIGSDGVMAGALLGAALWALPLVLLTGSVVWERVPIRSAAHHAADWLIKLIAIGMIVGAFA